MMRVSATLALLLSALLAACATDKDVLANKDISQQGPLKVHPGLLGQPVPPELQPDARTAAPAATPPAAATDTIAAPAEPSPTDSR